MRNLKSYKLFENLEKDLTADIEDILQTLKDEEYEIKVAYYPGRGNSAHVSAHEDFRYNYGVQISKFGLVEEEVCDEIYHLISFMKSEGFPQIRTSFLSNRRQFADRFDTERKTIFIWFAKDRY